MRKRFGAKWVSVVEVMVMIVVLMAGIVGAYGILDSTSKFATTTELRIQAINIAREGLEAMENIRDTNWLKFSSDVPNCWKTFNYDQSCVGNATPPSIPAGDYTLFRMGSLWLLRSAGTAVYPALVTTNDAIPPEDYVAFIFRDMLMRAPTGAETSAYLTQLQGGTSRATMFNNILALPEYVAGRATIPTGTLDRDYFVYRNAEGRITQLGAATKPCSANLVTDCRMNMTRTIRISYPSADAMLVQSIVKWVDRSKATPYSITLSLTLSNWKKDL